MIKFGTYNTPGHVDKMMLSCSVLLQKFRGSEYQAVLFGHRSESGASVIISGEVTTSEL